MRVLTALALASVLAVCNAQRGSINICKAPSGGVKRAPGTIHDDKVDNGKSINCTAPGVHCGSVANAGYGDGLNCGTVISAPTGWYRPRHTGGHWS